MEEFEKIKDLIIDNEIKVACGYLRRYAISERTLNEILLQESKYYQLERDVRNGTIGDDNEKKERNKIVHGLLQIVVNVEKESLGKFKELLEDKKAEVSPNSKTDEGNERIDALYKAGDDYYNYAISLIGHDKRKAHGGCIEAAIYYRYITLERPNKPYGFLCLANTLKTTYLLNYSKCRNEEKFDEILSCVNNGKNVDKDKLYHDAFDLVLIDIKEYLKNEKKIKNIIYICIPLLILILLVDFVLLEHNAFDFDNASPTTYGVIGLMLLLIYAFSLYEKRNKHMVNK
ncbi:MAG: hypothetical protein KDC61_00810 [Saprospiraceae bacterium]|nr:hypothetical protein [Saprospiraceae bacterium]